MNNPSPLIPQGSMLEQKNRSRARVKVAFFCVVGVHVAAILVALLAQGCKRETGQGGTTETNTTPVVDTNLPPIDTNPPTSVVPSNPPTTAVTDSIPAPTAQAQEYVVQRGDSFSTIAPKFHVSVKALQAANPTVVPTRLQPGQKLVIPAPTTMAATHATNEPGAGATNGGQEYVVKPGDNLTKIAAQFGTTPNAIRKANNLTTDRIKVGDKLKIPGKAPAPASGPVPTPAAPVTPR